MKESENRNCKTTMKNKRYEMMLSAVIEDLFGEKEDENAILKYYDQMDILRK